MCEAAGVVAVIILALYAWGQQLSSNDALANTLYISTPNAALAAAVASAAVILYFWTPKKLVMPAAATLYALLILTTGMLVVESGGIDSPFIALWMAVSVFAGLFGLYGIGAVLLIVNMYIIYNFFGQNLTREDLIVCVIAGELPMFVSYILWNGRESLEEARDHDVSQLNKTLEQESTKADAIIEAIGDGVIVVSQTGEVLLINPAAQQMTGWSADDALHLHFESVLKLEDGKGGVMESSLNPISRVLNVGQQVREKEISIVTKSGKHIFAAFVVSPMGQSGDGAIAVFRDITKERDDLRAQAEFISTASHEMRTPVASIEGYLGLALNPNTATVDEKARDFINKAHMSAQHLGRLFQDLLDVTKADDGRLKENPTVIDVVEFTRDIIEGQRPKAEEKQLKLIYSPDGTKATAGTMVITPVLHTHVDKDHLREVLDNLVENAIKYTPSGSVTIDVTASDNYIRLAIQDSGVGIPAEDIPHLFQKFYRVDSTDTREIGGTGLGLYLCRKLIEAMEGRIWVTSEYKKGSTFFIEVPRIDHARASELLQREADSQRQTAGQHNSIPAMPSLNETIHEQSAASGTVEQPVAIPTPPPQTAAPTPAPTPPPVQQTQPPAVVPSTPAPATLATPRQPVYTQPVASSPQKFGAVAYAPPSEPALVSAQPQTQAPSPQVQQTTQAAASPQRANIPLDTLERNPEHYVSQRQNPPKM